MSRVLTDKWEDWVTVGLQLGGRQRKSYDTEPSKQSQTSSQHFSSFLEGLGKWEVKKLPPAWLPLWLELWFNQTPGRRSNSTSWTLKFPSQETNSMRRSLNLKSLVDISLCSRYSEARHYTAPPGSVAENYQRSNVVLHNRQWIIILVLGETLPTINIDIILTAVTDRLVSPHPSNAGCTWASESHHPGIVSIWREIIPCLSSYADQVWQQRTQSRWRISQISKEVLGVVVLKLYL